jgi:hypothetical protein
MRYKSIGEQNSPMEKKEEEGLTNLDTGMTSWACKIGVFI